LETDHGINTAYSHTLQRVCTDLESMLGSKGSEVEPVTSCRYRYAKHSQTIYSTNYFCDGKKGFIMATTTHTKFHWHVWIITVKHAWSTRLKSTPQHMHSSAYLLPPCFSFDFAVAQM